MSGVASLTIRGIVLAESEMRLGQQIQWLTLGIVGILVIAYAVSISPSGPQALTWLTIPVCPDHDGGECPAALLPRSVLLFPPGPHWSVEPGIPQPWELIVVCLQWT